MRFLICMWEHFFAAGGWGMYPVLVIGFFLVAAVVLDALRKERGDGSLVRILGVMTVASGLLGTLTGICTSVHYISQATPRKLVESVSFSRPR